MAEADADTPEQPETSRHEQLRQELHRAVDRLMDGPPVGQEDDWVCQTLSDLGFFARMAKPAIRYEIGRILENVYRPEGSFAIGKFGTSWTGAALEEEPGTFERRHNLARAIGAEIIHTSHWQLALAAVLLPVSRVAENAMLQDLAVALRKLPLGVASARLQPSKKRRHGGSDALTLWELRLAAVAWVRFLSDSKRQKNDAESCEAVQKAFGLNSSENFYKDWRKELPKAVGREIVDKMMTSAGQAARLARGDWPLLESQHPDYCKWWLEKWSDMSLERDGKSFQRLTKRSHKKAHEI